MRRTCPDPAGPFGVYNMSHHEALVRLAELEGKPAPEPIALEHTWPEPKAPKRSPPSLYADPVRRPGQRQDSGRFSWPSRF